MNTIATTVGQIASLNDCSIQWFVPCEDVQLHTASNGYRCADATCPCRDDERDALASFFQALQITAFSMSDPLDAFISRVSADAYAATRAYCDVRKLDWMDFTSALWSAQLGVSPLTEDMVNSYILRLQTEQSL